MSILSLLALVLASPQAHAGTLADHAGNYRAAAQNSSYCPQETTLTLAVEANEQSCTATLAGPGTVNGVPVAGSQTYELGQTVEVPRLPVSHYERMVIKNGKVLVQDRGKFSFSWTDEDTLFDFGTPDAVTVFYPGIPCVFDRAN